MKNYLSLKIAISFGWLVFFSGCNPKVEENKPVVKFASISQSEWNVSGKKFYLINLSMRKIDSLSAQLNLRFTRENAQGL